MAKHSAGSGGVDPQPDPDAQVHLGPLGLRDEGALLGGEPAGRVQHHAGGDRHVDQAEEVGEDPGQPGGRMATISGSRPTISVSVWWRVWLQRHTVGSRMIMNDPIW